MGIAHAPKPEYMDAIHKASIVSMQRKEGALEFVNRGGSIVDRIVLENSDILKTNSLVQLRRSTSNLDQKFEVLVPGWYDPDIRNHAQFSSEAGVFVWSPDGRYGAAPRSDGQIVVYRRFLVDILGREVETMAAMTVLPAPSNQYIWKNSTLCWSPDGKWLTQWYTSVTNPGGYLSQHSRWIPFDYKLGPNVSSSVLIKASNVDAPHVVQFTPDGKYIHTYTMNVNYPNNDSYTIYKFDSSTGLTKQKITNLDTNFTIFSSVSNGNGYLLASSGRNASGGTLYETLMYRYDPTSSSVVPIFRSDSDTQNDWLPFRSLVWHPSSEFYTSFDPVTKSARIYRRIQDAVALVTSVSVGSEINGELPIFDWSPDGRYFVMAGGTQIAIYAFDSVNGAIDRLGVIETGGVDVSRPIVQNSKKLWSPDGKILAIPVNTQVGSPGVSTPGIIFYSTANVPVLGDPQLMTAKP